MVKSARLYARGVLKRLYWLAPTLFLDPFDAVERYWGIVYNPPQWLTWVLLIIGFLVAGGLTYHELRGEKLKTESILENRQRNREIREKLGDYLERGREWLIQCSNEKAPPPEDNAEQWANDVEQFLASHLDNSYISRFRSSAGLPLTANSISSYQHRQLWAGIHVRLSRLTEFITELSAIR